MTTGVNARRRFAGHVDQAGAEPRYAPNGLGGASAYHQIPIPVPDVDSPSRMQSVRVDLADGDHITLDALRAVLDDLKSRLDSMNEMSELASLRLQMIMDRRSKFLETLSKLLKKMPDTDTDSGIVQNVK